MGVCPAVREESFRAAFADTDGPRAALFLNAPAVRMGGDDRGRCISRCALWEREIVAGDRLRMCHGRRPANAAAIREHPWLQPVVQ